MSVSVIIPCHNDTDLLSDVIVNLLETADDSNFEIIVVNDGSISDDGKFMRINSFYGAKVLNIPTQRGVGASFDAGVEACSGDIIVLMGSDVFTDKGWLQKVREGVMSCSSRITCTACVGVTPSDRDIHRDSRHVYYGADLLIEMGFEDLPEARQEEYLHARVPKTTYTDLFRAKWRPFQESTELYEIPCLLGAFYFTTKEFYQKIHGWDTEAGKRFCGHSLYGHLESMLSLKAWLYGGSCYIDPTIKTGHIFGRINKKTAKSHRALKPSHQFFNALWIAHTMCDASLRDKLINYLIPELNLNKAKTYIKRNYENVLKVRERNEREFVHDLFWYMDKFGYTLK